MRRRLRAAALDRVAQMMGLAVAAARSEPALARRYAALAWRTCTKHRLRMPYEMRVMFCRRCKSFIPPGGGSRTRLGGGPPRAVRVTCLYCGHIRRKILADPAGSRTLTPTTPGKMSDRTK